MQDLSSKVHVTPPAIHSNIDCMGFCLIVMSTKKSTLKKISFNSSLKGSKNSLLC